MPRLRGILPSAKVEALRGVRMASGTGNSPPPAHEEEQVLEGEDAFEIPSKNASHDHLRRWRVRRLHYYSSVQIQRFFSSG